MAHGRMESSEIEDIMHRFIHGGFHVLVSTTIIETGIDIPNVNPSSSTAPICTAFRSCISCAGASAAPIGVAYAYLFYPDRRALNELAMKRLQIISDFTELGSGLKIAMKDLEVRGAGISPGENSPATSTPRLDLVPEASRRCRSAPFRLALRRRRGTLSGARVRRIYPKATSPSPHSRWRSIKR